MDEMYRMPAHGSRHGGQWPTHRAKARRRRKVKHRITTPIIDPKRDQR